MKENSERTAYQRLQQAEQREGIRLKNVNAFRTRVDHKVYVETYLPKSREKFLEKFVNDINEENTIDANFKYYVNHSNYLTFRNKIKLDEEHRDLLDRVEEEKEEKAAAKAASISVAGTKLKISLKRKKSESDDDDEENENGSVKRQK
ncbi:unnamed protein product [Ambrosiozyma monospora]|uniref:Unnamed protein product n=1 Tax=Ambrosiozyma monospora TaxID=43982 RepID=A0ACB5T9C1_AMBMO|nr:unnamed protein product [Ambrosiozyma monospora]